MKSWVVLSLFASLALAQSSSYSATTPSTSGDPLIPSGLSDGCKNFITAFNTDDSLTACTKSLIEATANYGPGGSATSSPSTADVTGVVDNICTGSASAACPDSLIRGKLADFYAACSSELTSKPVPELRNIYDVLYTLTPLKLAICSKDDSSNYCVLGGDASSTGIKGALASGGGPNLDGIQNSLSYDYNKASLSRRGENAIVANLTTFHNNNLAYLFRDPEMDTTALCTTCTRNILTGYFNFESDVMFALGLANSQLLGGQTALVGAIQDKCGVDFLDGAVTAAGGIKSGSLSSGAVKGVSDRFAGVIAVVAGGLTVTIASLL